MHLLSLELLRASNSDRGIPATDFDVVSSQMADMRVKGEDRV
jgi:hypothetical protein